LRSGLVITVGELGLAGDGGDLPIEVGVGLLGGLGQSIFVGSKRFGRNARENGVWSDRARSSKNIVYKDDRSCVLFMPLDFNCPQGFSQQEEDLSMTTLTLKVAVSLVNAALAAGRKINAAPLTVAVLDAGGHLLTLQREDGASLLRPQVATGKAWGAIALGKGSRLLAGCAATAGVLCRAEWVRGAACGAGAGWRADS